MIRTRSKKVLLVASRAFSDSFFAGYDTVKQIAVQTAIFPTIHELKPDVIVFDYQTMGNNMEKVLRRLQTNNFYRNIKICCYKSTEQLKVDSLLKVLGVDYFIYQDEVQKVSKSKAAINALNNVIDVSIINWMAGVAN